MLNPGWMYSDGKEVVIDKKDNNYAPIGSRTRVHRLGSDDDNRYTIGALHLTTVLCQFESMKLSKARYFHNSQAAHPRDL